MRTSVQSKTVLQLSRIACVVLSLSAKADMLTGMSKQLLQNACACTSKALQYRQIDGCGGGHDRRS